MKDWPPKLASYQSTKVDLMVTRVTEAGQSYIACERGLAIRGTMDHSRPNGHYLGLLELLSK